MGSRKLNGWEFTCDNPACGKVEAIYKVRNILADTTWLQGEMDQDEGNAVVFAACQPDCLRPAVMHLLALRAKQDLPDDNGKGGY